MSVRLIASERSWITGDAETQLRRVAELPGVVRVVGMPDLHPGKGAPVGVAVTSEGRLYPHLVGNDIGCGMALWRTDLAARRPKLDRWVKKLRGLETRTGAEFADRLAAAGIAAGPYDDALGTIGRGNHFAELQAVHEVADPAAFAALGLVEEQLVLLVHSGSRGSGEAVLRRHRERHGFEGLDGETVDAAAYLEEHDRAVAWARVNRAVIAERFLGMLGAAREPVVDLCHNSVQAVERGGRRAWLHRKGSAPSDEGAVVLAGSRGALSYLVLPVGDQEENSHSIAHGAGRKWARSDARGRLERRFTVESLRRTELGGRVICDDRELLYEEAPQAYKDVGRVVQDLVEAGLVRVVASFRPLITYKLRAR